MLQDLVVAIWMSDVCWSTLVEVKVADWLSLWQLLRWYSCLLYKHSSVSYGPSWPCSWDGFRLCVDVLVFLSSPPLPCNGSYHSWIHLSKDKETVPALKDFPLPCSTPICSLWLFEPLTFWSLFQYHLWMPRPGMVGQ